MNKPFYTITENDNRFCLELFDRNCNLIIASKAFERYKDCYEFLDRVKLHMCFQTNFCRKRFDNGCFGFEVRTCWDDLVAESKQYLTRQEREDGMLDALNASKNAQYQVPMEVRNVA